VTVEVSTLRHGIADVMALGRPDKAPKLAIIEVKRTRADLLADLRAGKMLKYAGIASHCYLLVHGDCMQAKAEVDVVAELDELGLPPEWGILRVRMGGHAPRSLRGAKKLQGVSRQLVEVYTRTFARSLAWKLSECEERLQWKVAEIHRLERLNEQLRTRLQHVCSERAAGLPAIGDALATVEAGERPKEV